MFPKILKGFVVTLKHQKMNIKEFEEWFATTLHPKDIQALLEKWKQGDKDAELQLSEIASKGRDMEYDQGREMVLAGYEPAFVLFELGNHGSNEETFVGGDYANEFHSQFSALVDRDIEDARKICRRRRMYTFEERYFYAYYDISTKTLRKSKNKNVQEVAKIVTYINENFETIERDEFLKLLNQLYLIVTGEEQELF